MQLTKNLPSTQVAPVTQTLLGGHSTGVSPAALPEQVPTWHWLLQDQMKSNTVTQKRVMLSRGWHTDIFPASGITGRQEADNATAGAQYPCKGWDRRGLEQREQ